MPLVTVDGVAQLRTTLRRSGHGMDELKAAGRAAASIVAPYARVRAPRGPDVGGHIADTVRVASTQRGGIVRVGGARRPYAGPIHWGWPARHIAAQPWVVDAAHDTETKWLRVYMQHIENLLDQVEGD